LLAKPRFLHFAPEPGLQRRLRRSLNARYVTSDIAMSGVDMLMDITEMRIPDRSFDFIYCSNVLEHVHDDRKAIAEMFRVLAPGGRALIQVPICEGATREDPRVTRPEDRSRLFGQADHVRFYGRDIASRLREARFEVEELVMLEVLKLPPQEIKRMNLNKREFVYLSRRPD
jgi:SAM-dependent methyltransferase